jgi:hypothetical protein
LAAGVFAALRFQFADTQQDKIRVWPAHNACDILRIPAASYMPRSRSSGRSAAWLARLVRDQEVEGSNPFAPTNPFGINNFIFSNSAKNANERLVQNHLLFVLSPLRERSFLLLIDRVGKSSGFIASVFDARLGTG